MTPKVSMPSNEHKFEISVKGDRSGQLYIGSFRYKRPNLGLIRQARVMKAKLNEDLQNLDADVLLLNEMTSWLSVSLMEAPPWWIDNGFSLYDMNVIEEIYSKVLEFENSFHKKIEKIGKSSEEKQDDPPDKS